MLPSLQICLGDQVQLQAAAGISYSWSPATGLNNPNLAAPLAYPASTTTYTATITMADGSIVKNVVKVVVNAAPDARITVAGSTILCAGQQVVLTAGSGAAYLWSTGEKNRSITVGESGAYSVLVTSAGGCIGASEEIYVEVTEAAQAQAGPDVSICAGSSTRLAATGGLSYSWYPAIGLSDSRLANPVATPEETTVYTVTVTHAGGCTSTDQVTVRVNPKPVISLEGFPERACYQDTLFNLAASLPAAGMLSGPGVVNNQFSPKTAGVGTHQLTYTYTDPASGCVSSATTTITVEACPGQEIVEGDGVKIYPNPSGGLYYLDIDSSKQPIQLKVYNMNGQLVINQPWKQFTTNGKPVLDIRHYARGVYQLQLIMKGEVIQKRLVLE